jgi:methionyl-tRNA formyltransferase
MGKPSIILLGSKPAAVVALSILLERGWDVKYVVVAKNFDLSWYGGQSIEELARDNGIKVVTQAELPRDTMVDFVVSYQFRNLVKPDVLALARRAALNFHAAPLPEFGGFAYYSVAILEDVSIYGCTCHHMDEGFDTGPLFKVRRFPINARQETAYSLEARAQEEMLRLFVDVCYLAETQEELPLEEQDRSKSRYLKREQMEALKAIPADADAETIDRYARAFWYPPYECAYIKFNDTKVDVVPQIAKEPLAFLLHAGDLERLQMAVRNYDPSELQYSHG